jgi:hypothetical protein
MFQPLTFLFDSLLHTLLTGWTLDMYVSLSRPVNKVERILYLKENTCPVHVISYHIC